MSVLTLSSELSIDAFQAGKLLKFEVVPTADEIAALMARFNFVAIDNCHANLSIRKVARDCWDVNGRLTANVVQSCVVTGEPIAESVDFLIEERYVREPEDADAVEVNLDGVEPLKNGAIDIGEMVSQSLALAVTAWPRADGAEEGYQLGEMVDEHPFAGLSVLKKSDN